MGRLPVAYRPDLVLLLVVACHSGERLDWGDFEVSSAERETGDVGSAVASTRETTAHDSRSVPGVTRERPDPLRDAPDAAAPVDASSEGQAGGKDGRDAGGSTASVPSSDGGADEPDAGETGDGGNDDNAGPAPSATQVCPAPGGGPQEVRLLPDGGTNDCWVGETWELGRTFASGALSTADGLTLVGAYLFGGAASAKTQAYDADGNPLPGCVVIDDTADRRWREIAFDGATCQGAAFARVTAHTSPDGDL